MRILNIVFNVEIKISATHKLGKNNTTIFGLTTNLEKPTRGKLVREGVFIIWELQRNSITACSCLEILNEKIISITMPSLHTRNEQNSSKLFP
jgi:hypothetical protein